MKSFYDFKNDSPQERLERNSLYPELAMFHIALREELGEEEYFEFFRAEKEAAKRYAPMLHQAPKQWMRA